MEGLARDPTADHDRDRLDPETSSKVTVSSTPRAAQRPAFLEVSRAFPTQRPAFCALGLGIIYGGEQRLSHHWLTLESSGHSVFAQLHGAGGRSGCYGPG